MATGLAGAALPMEAGEAKALRDVSLEKRCDALKDYLARFAVRYLAGLEFAYSSCAEGSGVGGTVYSLDFIASTSSNDRSYRIDVVYRGTEKAEIKLCDTNDSPTICSTNSADQPLRFDPGSSRFPTEETATAAATSYLAMHEKMGSLLPTIATWAAAPQSRHLIFGQDYLSFVDTLIKGQPAMPVTKADRIASIPVKLVPRRSNPLNGTMLFPKGVNEDLAKCLDCKSVPDCNTRRIIYQFEDRLLRISAMPSGAKQLEGASKDLQFNSGWIMSGQQPIPASGRPWQFSCNLTRYSLQAMNY